MPGVAPGDPNTGPEPGGVGERGGGPEPSGVGEPGGGPGSSGAGEPCPASVSGPVGAGQMHADDWGGGYYPQGLQQADLNEGRLLMHGVARPGSSAADIPFGRVHGYGYVSDESDELELKLVPVGRSHMGTRQPEHQ